MSKKTKYSNEELRTLSGSPDASVASFANELLEKRLDHRQFLKGTLVAWLALIVSLISLCVAIAAFRQPKTPTTSPISSETNHTRKVCPAAIPDLRSGQIILNKHESH